MAQLRLIVGFDFGTKQIGCAVADSISQSVTKRCCFSGDPKEGREAISAFLKKWSPDLVLVGLPVHKDGSDLSVTSSARDFGLWVEEEGFEVVFVNEAYTTQEAKELLFEKHGFQGLSKDKIDALSAQLICEQWMQTTPDFRDKEF